MYCSYHFFICICYNFLQIRTIIKYCFIHVFLLLQSHLKLLFLFATRVLSSLFKILIFAYILVVNINKKGYYKKQSFFYPYALPDLLIRGCRFIFEYSINTYWFYHVWGILSFKILLESQLYGNIVLGTSVLNLKQTKAVGWLNAAEQCFSSCLWWRARYFPLNLL